ncbi:MAG: DNA topoisomerase IV subunit A [Proteobacteria bacterium]|nr:DNA topoisomerase IV subunit A [Pseudomonadota bacterium]
MANLEPLMRRNFLEYASYSILDRAIPELRDGCKPVQRRILQTLFDMNDGHFHKVANVIGEAMKLHPHGDASIADALVVLANKDYFIERQGNFGNLLTGHPPAAARYIECRLTPLALETLFQPDLTEFQPSYDGRRREPVFLPAKLPVALMLGVDGIAVGMATRILPHNLIELLRAQVRILRGESFELVPDFPQGGQIDVSEYDLGRGRVRVRARIEARGDKKVVITEIPYGTTTESLIASLEGAAQKGRVKISGIDDFTTDRVEIELALARGVYADEVIPQLYAYTDCEVSLTSNVVVIRDGRPAELTVPVILEHLTAQLRELIERELDLELERLRDRRHWLTLEQIFIENRVYKRIEKARTEEGVRKAVWKGMEPFAEDFEREMTDEDVRRLLEIRIRRISAYDIDRNRRDLEALAEDILGVQAKLADLTGTAVAYLEDLIERYAERYPRRSQVTTFDEVDKKAVARQNLKLSYDPQSSFFGSDVRGKDFGMTVSEYDRILAISSDGSYRILAPPEKQFLPKKLLYCAPFDTERGIVLTVVYRDGKKIAFGKKVHIHKFVTNREYRLVKDPKGRIDALIPDGQEGRLHLSFVPAKRQRVKEAQFDLREIPLSGTVGARGTRLAPKPVSRLKRLPRDTSS